MPRPRGYALVLNLIVFSNTHTCLFSCVLIDGGSSINLLYRTSMEKLRIPIAQLKPSKFTFHGIMSGLSCTPMGRVQFEVLFGEKVNFCRKPIWFEVVDLSSPYHALLGRPPLAKFMAVLHYAYLKIKLPGPHGVITITGCYKKLMECAKASSKMAEALVIAEEKRQLLRWVAANLKPANDAKKIPTEVDKMVKVVTSGGGSSAK
jgi:hypothetical protein